MVYLEIDIESIEDEGLRECIKEFKERSVYLQNLITDFSHLHPDDIVFLCIYTLNGHRTTMSLKYNGQKLEEDINL